MVSMIVGLMEQTHIAKNHKIADTVIRIETTCSNISPALAEHSRHQGSDRRSKTCSTSNNDNGHSCDADSDSTRA